MTQEKVLRMALDWITKQPDEVTHNKYDVNTRYAVIKEIEEVLAQPQRTWVGLTDEEIDYYIVHRFGVATKKNLVELIRLCEAKSKEKNHG